MLSASVSAGAANLLFVVGMHRSGTSALCAALHACGATFGERLLAPMAGVNDEGFWEDADVVAANDALLAAVGATWYSLAPLDLSEVGGGNTWVGNPWPDDALARFHESAEAILQRGFGPGPVQVVKDPRLCLTLPLWLQACASLGLHAQVCAAARAPLEVAQSLQRRDDFPLAYGLRLDLAYRTALAAALPAASLHVLYPELIENALQVLKNLAAQLPLQVSPEAIARAVKPGLRHHQAALLASDLLEQAYIPAADLPALADCLEQRFPVDAMVADVVSLFVARGAELTSIGEAHSQALTTIAERDLQIAELDQHLQDTGAWLERALATISERDAQIVSLDERLAESGAQHSHALAVIAEKDREIAEKDREIADKDRRLAEIYNLPVLGGALRAARRFRSD